MNVNNAPASIQRTAVQDPRQRLANAFQAQQGTVREAKLPLKQQIELPGSNQPTIFTVSSTRDGSPPPTELAKPDVNALVSELRSDLNLNQSGSTDNPVQALLDAWGTESTEYDLNNDGTVNMFDLLELLKQLSAQPQPQPAVPDDVDVSTLPVVQTPEANEEPKPQGNEYDQRLQDLLNAWGTDNAASDLNGDGTVDVFDLTELISQYSSPTPDAGTSVNVGDQNTTVAGSIPQDDPQIDPQPNDAPLTVQSLLEAWGTENSQYDLNNDGEVNVFDLLALLDSLSPTTVNEDALSTSLNENSVLTSKRSLRQGQGQQQKLENLSDRLYDKLVSRGYDTKPPANLDSVLERFKLGDDHQSTLKQKILANYPIGSGVNAIG